MHSLDPSLHWYVRSDFFKEGCKYNSLGVAQNAVVVYNITWD
jgi:hypothetical protein